MALRPANFGAFINCPPGIIGNDTCGGQGFIEKKEIKIPVMDRQVFGLPLDDFTSLGREFNELDERLPDLSGFNRVGIEDNSVMRMRDISRPMMNGPFIFRNFRDSQLPDFSIFDSFKPDTSMTSKTSPFLLILLIVLLVVGVKAL